MKMLKKLFLLCVVAWGLSSCIRDEALNSEADILSFRLPEEVTFGESQISNNEIILFVKKGTDVSNLSPEVVITEGATISPSPSQTYDFTKDQVFAVTSQDGNYTKNYAVKTDLLTNYHYDFEEWSATQKNYPLLASGLWQSGNFGVWFMPPIGKKEVYPTRPTEDCVEGSLAVELETLEGKEVWNNFYSIFSGSVYYGTFTLVQSEPARGVRFGHPHPKDNGKPIRFTGYYKYKPGAKFIDKEGNEVKGRVDECTVRSFLYKLPKGLTGTALNNELLTGVDGILTSEKLVAIAELEDTSAKGEFTYFDIKFDYKESIDYEQYDYRLAIVFSSSRRGDFYEGAIGSTLVVDDVNVICEDFKD